MGDAVNLASRMEGLLGGSWIMDQGSMGGYRAGRCSIGVCNMPYLVLGCRVRGIIPIMKNVREKNMENELGADFIQGFGGLITSNVVGGSGV